MYMRMYSPYSKVLVIEQIRTRNFLFKDPQVRCYIHVNIPHHDQPQQQCEENKSLYNDTFNLPGLENYQMWLYKISCGGRIRSPSCTTTVIKHIRKLASAPTAPWMAKCQITLYHHGHQSGARVYTAQHYKVHSENRWKELLLICLSIL